MTSAPHPRLSIIVLVAALTCIVAGLFPHRSQRFDPRTQRSIITWTVGLPFSPVGTSVNSWAPDGTFDTEGKVQFVSWSWASIALGVVLLGLRKRHRRMHLNSNKTTASRC